MNFKNASLLLLFCLAICAALAGQTEEPIKESVSVVNVEVPVRVFANGQSISGLNKEDFEISEDGRAQQINGFYFFHKKINADPETLEGLSPDQKSVGRYFVLIFRIYDCNEDLEKGLAYLFDSILQPEDQVFVMANNRTLMIDKLATEPGAQEKILELLRSESQGAHNQMLSALRSIEQSVDMTKFRVTLRSPNSLGPDYVNGFLDMYLKVWQDFKRRFLSLELDKFYYFSRHLQNIKKEKWVLNFYQLEQFPKIAIDSEMQRILRNYVRSLEESDNPTLIAQGRIINKLMQNIEMEMLVAKDFPSEEVSKLFYKVNATFHSFFIRGLFDSGNQELQFRDVASDIENSLKALTEATGGTLTTSNKIAEALASVSEKSDDYYVLTYEPTSRKKIGNIKVKVKGKRYDVLYDNNIRADYISAYLKKKEAENPTVKITELSFQGGKLSFAIGDFSMARVNGETAGMLAVRIRVKNADGQSFFDQNKTLQTDKKRISLSLNFNFLAADKYDIIVDVLDQVSGKTCTEVIQPQVN
ncbi:MAG: hypothetical protein MUP71_14680 [Candidatus Aminicenantes bacterium]|nr:hypothetical protein [Candidatus Aminicenantes bacterium]